MNSALISDIDGTLLYRSDTAPPEVERALQKYQERGNLVGLCTGRALGGCYPIIDSFESLNLPSIFFGGALIWDTNHKKEILSRPLSHSIFDVVTAIKERYPQVSITMNSRDEGWTVQTNEVLQNRATYFDRNTKVVDYLPSKDERILKVLLTAQEPEIIKEIQKSLLDPSLYHSVFASRHFFEITDQAVDKGSAIEIIKEEHAPLKGKTLWAAGDAPSDAPMREYVDKFAAPEDAHPKVIELADYLFPSAKESGIVKFIDHLLE